MVSRAKKWLYFPLARYFAWWARRALKRWRPRVILVTGSSGKTTLLHLIEAQLGERAHYSHRANSAFGIPFDILDLHPEHASKWEWLGLIWRAPQQAFRRSYEEKIYVVEADSDRPGEARFINRLVKPEVVIWLSSDLSHGVNFKGEDMRRAIADEFGHYLAGATLSIINDDNALIRTVAHQREAVSVSANAIQTYTIEPRRTTFKIDNRAYSVPGLVPRETGLGIQAIKILCDYLQIEHDPAFRRFVAPPGRSSVLAGIKKTLLIDSSYNAIPDAVRAIFQLFAAFPAQRKWLVLSDLVEQGKAEAETHRALATEIAELPLERIILMGPRMRKFTAPALLPLTKKPVAVFETPREVLDYLQTEITGGECILFKGSRFLEGIIEHLLANPADAAKLCRREKIWQKRRKKWGL